MGNDLQQVALDIIGLKNDIDKDVSQLLRIDQLFFKLPFEKKVKMIRLLLKDRIVPGDKTFQNALNNVSSVMARTEVFANGKMGEDAKAQIRFGYDSETQYFYDQLLKQTTSISIKASSIFWDRFPQIIVFLKEMASLINFQQTDRS